MTIKEARQKMMDLFPERTVYVSVDAWQHDTGASTITSKVSIQPGIGGRPINLWSAPTMELALAKAEAALREMDEDEPDYECESE